MLFLRRRNVPDSEREIGALDRAEYLCDQAEAIHADAVAEAGQIVAQAKAEAARLLREAISLIDVNAARSEAARAEATRTLAEAKAIKARLAAGFAEPAVTDTLGVDELLDLRAFAS